MVSALVFGPFSIAGVSNLGPVSLKSCSCVWLYFGNQFESFVVVVFFFFNGKIANFVL